MQALDVSLESIMQELVSQQTRNAQGSGLVAPGTISSEEIGSLRIQSQAMPGLHISQVQWQVGQWNLRFADNHHTTDININLQLRGHMLTQYGCLSNPLDMRPCSHNLILTSEPGGHHQLKAGDSLEMFHLSLKPEQFGFYLDASTPLGESLLLKMEKKQAFAASPKPLVISPAMQAIVADLRNCSLQGHTRRLYQEAKITELLCLLLDAYAQYAIPLNKLPKQSDVEKLYALREYLQANYLQQDLSLASLGRMFGLNEFTLKKGFKQLFNNSVFGFIQQLRMEHARLLMLEEGLSVSQAADMLGYANPQHFSTAYKKLWGHNPGKMVAPHR